MCGSSRNSTCCALQFSAVMQVPDSPARVRCAARPAQGTTSTSGNSRWTGQPLTGASCLRSKVDRLTGYSLPMWARVPPGHGTRPPHSRCAASTQHKLPGRGPRDRTQRHALVEADQATAVPHGQAEQVHVGELPVPVKEAGIEDLRIQHTEIVRPERMGRRGGGAAQHRHELCQRYPQQRRDAWEASRTHFTADRAMSELVPCFHRGIYQCNGSIEWIKCMDEESTRPATFE